MRLGLIGDDSSHADLLVEYLKNHPDLGELTAVMAPTKHWAGAQVVDAPRDMVGLVDGVAVLDRDAKLHWGHTEPLLGSGMRVFVDKPFTASLPQARRLIGAALAGKAAVSSSSAIRWFPEVRQLRAATWPRVRSVEVSGPVDRNDPRGGIIFYAIHSIELALHLAAGQLKWIVAHVKKDRVRVEVGAQSNIVIDLLEDPDVPFTAVVTTDSGKQQELSMRLGENYFDPMAKRIVDFLSGGSAPVPPRDILGVMQVMANVQYALAAKTG